MAITTSTLSDTSLNPAITPRDLFDLETGLRETFNYLLDAEETNRNIRDAARSVIQRFLEELKAIDMKPRQVLVDFTNRTADLFESATCHQSQVRASSAKCLLELWAKRTQIYSPAFQRVLIVFKRMSANFPLPDLFAYHCFRALTAIRMPLGIIFSRLGLYRLELRSKSPK